MVKTIFLLAAFIGVASVVRAEDSWLYWMVDVDKAQPYVESRGYAFDDKLTAKVRVQSEDGAVDTYLLLTYGNSETPMGYSVGGDRILYDWDNYFNYWAELPGSSVALTKNSGLDDYSFVVELFYDSVWIGQSEALPYSKAGDMIVTEKTTPPTDLWMASTYAVPEPNSALLTALGLALLALRRRRSHA